MIHFLFPGAPVLFLDYNAVIYSDVTEPIVPDFKEWYGNYCGQLFSSNQRSRSRYTRMTYLLSVLSGGTIANGETSGNEIILNVDYKKRGDGPHNLL